MRAILTQSEGRFTRKKLIEVALPLEEINRKLVREKESRHGYSLVLDQW